MTRQYFGTDGIRGEVGEGAITPDFMLKLGWACGRVFSRLAGSEGRCLVIIGKDTRVSGYMFESALEAGLVAAGVDVKLLGPMPTPAVALMTQTLSADAGIVISASHNPFQDNGIKFFSASGSKLPDEIELAIEAELEHDLETVGSRQIGKVLRVVDAAGRYIEFCKSTVPEGFNLRGMRIAVDCANGATYHIAPGVFSELGAEVLGMGTQPDGFNINEGVGSTDTAALSALVRERNADLGIAFDGDGDRVLFVDANGELVDGDELIYVIARHRLATGSSDAGVVGTLMTNLGMEIALRDAGLELARAQVGDRFVKEMMEAEGWHLGGESSGHIICSDITTTGDGIVAALQVLRAVRESGETLAALRAGMTKYPQTMINVRMAGKVNLEDYPQVAEAVARVEQELGSRGRVLLRPSGTEPVVRVMVEGEDEAEVHTLCQRLAADVERCLT
ncbi:phosphoglucosamine mutase [Pseudohalioglobus sediminis]|uniref:Phosphoglucosamine mutase n=1 Tax=Pseudohalioglobus sediminis TaxID=2606449 RepID=A0A5B0WT02_9GAMM|nr:phosphoglucosamine mutase [Pseudohalioglobus sediminis]KAA1190036.1 phosphoglucosamine mutase [Pseudohalioglobus sediminis]